MYNQSSRNFQNAIQFQFNLVYNEKALCKKLILELVPNWKKLPNDSTELQIQAKNKGRNETRNQKQKRKMQSYCH